MDGVCFQDAYQESGHRMVRHENSAILTGGLTDGDNVSDGIYESRSKSSI